METIAICSSIKNLELIKSTIIGLKQLGIRGLFPNIDFVPVGENLSIVEMRMLQKDHFSAISSSEAIYVINPKGYIGTMVTAEIGYALGQTKAIYFSEVSGQIELDALTTGIISLDSIRKFKIA